MSIRQQLYDLKAQRAGRLTAARSALENDDMQTYSEELQAAQEMNSKIESIEKTMSIASIETTTDQKRGKIRFFSFFFFCLATG